MRALRLLPFVLLPLVLASCDGRRAEPWERPDHTPPTSAEVFYCHQEAHRQALARYPDRPANEQRNLPAIEDDRRFPAEIRFYEQCMTRQSFVRVVAPAR